MASIKITMPDELIKTMSTLGNRTDEIVEKSLTASAKVVKSEVYGELQKEIGKNTKYKSRSTGELLKAMGVTPMKIDGKGNYNVKVGFSEPRKNGKNAKSTNAMIANTIENGKKGQPPKPFFARGKRKSRAEALKVLIETFDSEVQKL